jgi:hypothetical protein
LVPRVGRRQDSAQWTRGSACISLSGASTATGPDSELGRAFVPPGGECRTILRGRLLPPRRRRDGWSLRCRDARIGPLNSSKGGPRHWQARGPGVRFSRLPASARRIGHIYVDIYIHVVCCTSSVSRRLLNVVRSSGVDRFGLPCRPPSTREECARGHRPRRRLLRFGLRHREAHSHALPTARRALYCAGLARRVPLEYPYALCVP